jgi:carbonic anhydrase
MNAADQALQRLRAGNARFVAGEGASQATDRRVRREQLTDGQAPFAIILGCADSRVPVEVVFDQGLGDLFVIRVAGNIVSSTQLGSIEFAAAELGVRLVLVLGHTRCGAMAAALRAVQDHKVPGSDNLRRIVDAILPSAHRALADAGQFCQDDLVDAIGRENVRHSVDTIRNASGIIRQLIEDAGLEVVGAEYSLATGAVEFL